MLAPDICTKARLSRDRRFDGKFFTAVKTTGIYCRPICPASPPKENNVCYFLTAIEAANAGYRPCLRCRPDSAPGSSAWKGVSTTLERAIQLIHSGALHQGSIIQLADRLGISERYLRKLFNDHLGIAPKAYGLYQQCLFAKKLLHETSLPITQIAFASGFNSVRQFNDAFRRHMQLTPSSLRKKKSKASNTLTLLLHYRPPYHWQQLQQFLHARVINNLEWCSSTAYGRTFEWYGTRGQFTAEHIPEKCGFLISLSVNNFHSLHPIIHNIRRVLDLDADIEHIENDLKLACPNIQWLSGLRLPGTWTLFEAGIRAILGQQVSVMAASQLVATLVENLGEKHHENKLFPTPSAIANHPLDCLKIPGARKDTLKRLAQHYCYHPDSDNPDEWLSIKGVGPWTVDYAKLRGLSDPDIYLAGDLGIQKAEKLLNNHFHPEAASPWRSYLTLHLWNQS